MEKNELNIGIDFSQKRADVGLFGPNGEKVVAHRAFLEFSNRLRTI